ncbi:MAG TPA: site-specific integrase, partial [Burkholderiales bacterium]|nr:site-specific integrase [Burkholderiales bacterium]
DQASAKARRWCEAKAAQEAGVRRGPYTVAQCLEDYLEYVTTHRKSVKHLDTYVKAYILPRLGHVDTAALTSAMIRQWHRAIAEEPPRLRTRPGRPQRYRAEDPNPEEARRKRRLRANRHLVTLRAALTRAWREGLIASNDAWARVQQFGGVERQRSRFLDHDAARRLLNACPPDLRALVQLALLSGARYGELCRLEVRDFQAASGTLFIRDSKSGKPRHVILNDEGIAFCRQLTLGRPPGEPLLRRDDGGRWDRDLHQRPFKAAVARAGLDPAFTFHELRHTWASLTIMAGAPLMVVAQNLGHRDTRMVEQHYGHLAQSYVTEMVRRTAPSFGLVPQGNLVPLPTGR